MKQFLYITAILLGLTCNFPVCAKDSETKEAPAKKETKTETKTKATETGTWEIDPAHSAVNFSVKHMMVSNVRGSFGKVEGNIKYDGKNLSKASVDATIDTTSISTQEPKRDEHLKKKDFLDVEKFPTMKFVSTKVKPGKGGSFDIDGNLTLHGVTKKVTLNAEPLSKPITAKGKQRMGASAKTKINRKEFGVSYNGVLDNGGAMVGDDIKIEIDLELVKTQDQAQS